jgi:hypothetical protein
MPRKAYKPRKRAGYINHYRFLEKDFFEIYNYKMGPELIYKVYQDWILKYLQADFSEEIKNRSQIYENTIYQDTTWIFDRIENHIIGLDSNKKQPAQLNLLYYYVALFKEARDKLYIRNEKYVELLHKIVEINNDERPSGNEYYKSTKIKNPIGLVNAIQDYEYILSIIKANSLKNANIDQVFKSEISRINNFIILESHAKNNKNELCYLTVGADKIPIAEKYAFCIYEEFKIDIFNLYNPFFNYLSITSEEQKSELIHFILKFFKSWARNENLFLKEFFRNYNDWFPYESKISKEESQAITTKQIIIVLYEALSFAFPNQISSLEKYTDPQKNLKKSYLEINKKTGENFIPVDLYERMRDEVEKFFKEVF